MKPCDIFPSRHTGSPEGRHLRKLIRNPGGARKLLWTAFGVTTLGCLLFPLLLLDSSPTVIPVRERQETPLAAPAFPGGLKITSGDGRKLITLTGLDVTTAAGLVLARKKLEGHVLCDIEGSRLEAMANLRLPVRFAQVYLNVRLLADDDGKNAVIRQLRIGRLDLPEPWAGWTLAILTRLPPLSRYGRAAIGLIREARIEAGRLTLVLDWNRDQLARAEDSIAGLADPDRLRIYHDRLAGILDDGSQSRFIRLGRITQALFGFARDRSAENREPVEENRALIMVLGAYVNGKDLARVLASGKTPARRGVLLNRRIDTAQHFTGSAALAMSGHGTLVEMIGLAKELHDTHDGSGFSFIDLAADEAGAAFGKNAIRSEVTARKIQEILSQSNDESRFIPSLGDLPENMGQVEFNSRFRMIDSPEYRTLKALISERIRALPIYQP